MIVVKITPELAAELRAYSDSEQARFHERVREWAHRNGRRMMELVHDQITNQRPDYAPDRHLWPFQKEKR